MRFYPYMQRCKVGLKKLSLQKVNDFIVCFLLIKTAHVMGEGSYGVITLM